MFVAKTTFYFMHECVVIIVVTKYNFNYLRYENVNYPEDGMDGTEEYIEVCGSCPENFPWLHNPMGE